MRIDKKRNIEMRQKTCIFCLSEVLLDFSSFFVVRLLLVDIIIVFLFVSFRRSCRCRRHHFNAMSRLNDFHSSPASVLRRLFLTCASLSSSSSLPIVKTTMNHRFPFVFISFLLFSSSYRFVPVSSAAVEQMNSLNYNDFTVFRIECKRKRID